jgi:hypothetical protein
MNMSEADPLEEALAKALDKESESKPKAGVRRRSDVLGDIRTVALILSLAANVWFGYLKLQEAREHAEAVTRKDVDSNVSRLLKEPDKGHEAELTLLAPYIKPEGPYSAEILSAYDTRLRALHSADEGRIIFQTLENAGPNGLTVALNANREAYAQLKDAVAGDAVYHVAVDPAGSTASGYILIRNELWNIVGGNSDIDGPDGNLVKSLFDLENSLDCARICGQDNQIYKPFLDRELDGMKSAGVSPKSFHDQLQILIEILHDSRTVAETLLPSAPCEDGAIRINGVFMPAIKAPKATYKCREASFADSYIEGADLTGLEASVQKLDFRNTVENADPYFDVSYTPGHGPAPSKYLARRMASYYMKVTDAQAKKAEFFDDK